MTLQEFAKKYSPRKAARALLNKRVYALCGMTLNDLPDTVEVCNLIDELEQCVAMNDIGNIKELIEQVNMEWLEENAF